MTGNLGYMEFIMSSYTAIDFADNLFDCNLQSFVSFVSHFLTLHISLVTKNNHFCSSISKEKTVLNNITFICTGKVTYNK